MSYQHHRNWYMEDSDARHQTYYGQFVNDYICRVVERGIGLENILNSKDPHFNDIPLHKWDRLGLSTYYTQAPTAKKVKAVGEILSQVFFVCVAKAAANIIKQQHEEHNNDVV